MHFSRFFSFSTSLFVLTSVMAMKEAQAETSLPHLFSPQERSTTVDLSGFSRIRFLTTVDFPPFNSIGSNGQLKGYNIDLARALCSQLNLDNICQIEAVPWSELQQSLLNGNGEAIIAGLAPNSENRKILAFSRPYMRLPARFVTQIGQSFTAPAATALKRKAVGVIGKSAHEQMLRNYIPASLPVLFSNRSDMLDALKAGKIAAAFDDGMALSFWLNDDQSQNCCAFADGAYFAPQYLGTGLSIAVSQNNVKLASAFDGALQALEKKGVLTDLYLRYFPLSFY